MIETPGFLYLPEGGNVGQLLAKLSNRDFDLGWVNASAGGLGGSIANHQVAFGIGTNIGGSNNFTFDNATNPTLRLLNSSDIGFITTGTVNCDFCFASTFLQLEPAARGDLGTPQEGMIYQDSTDHHLYVYNGTAWKQLDN